MASTLDRGNVQIFLIIPACAVSVVWVRLSCSKLPTRCFSEATKLLEMNAEYQMCTRASATEPYEGRSKDVSFKEAKKKEHHRVACDNVKLPVVDCHFDVSVERLRYATHGFEYIPEIAGGYTKSD